MIGRHKEAQQEVVKSISWKETSMLNKDQGDVKYDIQKRS